MTLLGILNPIKKGLLNEDLTSIEDQTSPAPKSGHHMYHGLFVDTFKRVRSDHSFDLLSQAERHQLGYPQMQTRAECDSEINAKHTSI